MNSIPNDNTFELLAKLGKANSPNEAMELLEKESELVDECFLFFFSDPVSKQLTATLIYPESKFVSIAQLASEYYNIKLILELLQLRYHEWAFFFRDHQLHFQFPFTLTYFDILLEGETGSKREYILYGKESAMRFGAARDLFYETDPDVLIKMVRESLVYLNTPEAKNYLADCVNDDDIARDKALFCLQTIADVEFNLSFDSISTEHLKTTLINASRHPEPGKKAKAMEECLNYMGGETDALKAHIQFHIAHAYVDSRTGELSANLEAAIFYFEEAGKFYTKESNQFAWARVQNGLARCFGLCQKNGAGANIEQSITYLRLAEEVFSPIDTPYDWAYTQNNLGAAYIERINGYKDENVGIAVEFFESALSVQSRLYCPEAWALSMTNLAEAYNNPIAENRIERVPKAISLFETVACLYTQQSHPFEWAVLQRRIGSAYMTLASADPSANIEIALSYFQKAKEILIVERYPNDWVVLMRQMGDAFIQRVQGDLMVNQESAIACYMSTFAVITIKTQPYSWATLHHALALIYRVRLRGTKKENMDLSKRHIGEAKLILKKEEFTQDWASLEHLQGILALEHRKPIEADDYENAISHFINALTIRNPKSSFHLWLETMNSLAGAHTDHQKGDTAINLQKGIDIYEEVLNKLSPQENLQSWCIITTNLARALVKTTPTNNQQQNRAKILLDEILKVQTPVNSPRECFKAAFILGKVYFDNENFEKALKAFQKCFESAENLRVQIVHDFFRKQLAEETSELFQKMVTCCLKLKDIDQAFYYASAGKARVFADLLQQRKAVSEIDARVLNPRIEELQTKIADLRRTIDHITTSSEYVLTGGHFLNTDNISLLSVVSDKRRELLKQLEEMALRFPDISDIRHAPVVSAVQLKQLSAARPNECWIEYYKHHAGWCAFILKAGELNYVTLPDVRHSLLNDTFVCMAECEQLALSGKSPDAHNDSLEQHLTYIHNVLIAPLSFTLSPDSRVVLSLSQELSLLPINIAFNADTGKYFCEEYTLSFIPGLNSLYWLLLSGSNQEEKIDKKCLLSIIHPGHTHALRLRFAKQESQIVQAHFDPPPFSITLNEKEACLDDILKHCNGGMFNAIHFVCHGHFNAADPTHSGLLLGDGILTAERVQASVEFKNKPVVLLSACQTGQEAIAGGDEGIGLVRSFFAAGAGTVIASQWSVNDASSLEIFRHYFDFNRSMPKAEALRQAGLSVKKRQGWSHPLYWSAFTITGIAD